MGKKERKREREINSYKKYTHIIFKFYLFIFIYTLNFYYYYFLVKLINDILKASPFKKNTMNISSFFTIQIQILIKINRILNLFYLKQ